MKPLMADALSPSLNNGLIAIDARLTLAPIMNPANISHLARHICGLDKLQIRIRDIYDFQ